MHGITKNKLELIRKIIDAKLTKDELQAVTDKAHEIIDRRPSDGKQGRTGEKVLH